MIRTEALSKHTLPAPNGYRKLSWSWHSGRGRERRGVIATAHAPVHVASLCPVVSQGCSAELCVFQCCSPCLACIDLEVIAEVYYYIYQSIQISQLLGIQRAFLRAIKRTGQVKKIITIVCYLLYCDG